MKKKNCGIRKIFRILCTVALVLTCCLACMGTVSAATGTPGTCRITKVDNSKQNNKKSGRTPTDHDHLQLQWSSRRNRQILSAITAFRSFLTAASPVSSGGGTHVFP